MNYKTLATKFEGTRQELLKLLGLSSDTGTAVATTEDTDDTVAELNKAAKDLDNKDYASMKVTELKRIAKERKLKGYSTLNKAALVELLLQN
tara:strand:- start:6381 stop:6656 length:276 start_codon:yes stop_codon:yes gene_type:complete